MSNLVFEPELNAVCQFSFIKGNQFVPPKTQHFQAELDEVCDFSFLAQTPARAKRKTAQIDALNQHLATRYAKANP